jgi:hypothetical protein
MHRLTVEAAVERCCSSAGEEIVQKKQSIARKPAYHHGQLLLEDDFIAEQQFHSDARYRHVRHLHGFGVAQGLEVSRAGELALSVSAGFAVDRRGHEIELHEPETLELHGLPPGALAWVTIGYRTEHTDGGHDGSNRIDCYAFLQVTTGVERNDVRLARVQLDERGRLEHHAINHHERDHLHAVVEQRRVEDEPRGPRTDWIATAFHPSNIPRNETDARPPFRVGATQAEAHRLLRGADGREEPNLHGAAGTMAIPLPPGVRHILRLRVAGAANDKGMSVILLKGGFDPQAMRHLREEVAVLEIQPPGPYNRTIEIAEVHRSMSERHRTLAVDIRSEGYVAVSLVAVEVSY